MTEYKYENPPQLSREQIIRIFSAGTHAEICEALLSTTLYDEDWKWSQNQCLYFLNHSDPDVKGLAATCLGHVARIHRQLDRELVICALKRCLDDAQISGRAQDALDDIQTFLSQYEKK